VILVAISRIKIKDFTVFKDIDIELRSGVNVFIGENGTGKTHLLKLMYASLLESQKPTGASIAVNSIYIFDLNHQGCIRRLFGQEIDIYDMDLYLVNTKNSNKAADVYKYDNDEWLSKQWISKDGALKESKVYAEFSSLGDPCFIPAKEVLSMSNIGRLSQTDLTKLNIDITLTDVIRKAQNLSLGEPSAISKKIAEKLETLIGGTVFVKEEDFSFWMQRDDLDEPIPFSMEAEGFRKLGLLWQLIENKSINEGTVLLWDEPEANINPNLIADLVEIILELSRNGVQVFIATHDYFFAQYMEVLAKESDAIAFHALSKPADSIICETSDKFTTLQNNEILEEHVRLYKKEIAKVMG